MSKKILKLAKTPIICYPDYVYPLSVILNEEDIWIGFIRTLSKYITRKMQKIVL